MGDIAPRSRRSLPGVFQLTDKVEIDWTAETPGTYTSYVDSVTGATWNRSTPASPGTLAASISATGVKIAGTAGAADQFMQWAANINPLFSGAGDRAFDPALDVIEVVHVCSVIDIATAWTQCVLRHQITGSGYVLSSGWQNSGGTKKRRIEQIGPSTDIFTGNETVTSAVVAHRIHAGATIGTKYKNTAVGEVTDWASLSTFGTKLRWSVQADENTGDVDSLASQVQIGVLGQATGNVEIEVSKTIIRRFEVS